MENIKHVGRIIKTGRKCVVAYRTLPGDAYHCLVVATENLTPDQHDALIKLVESPAGQDAYEFAEAMSRARFPDGSTMLAALHTQGRLVKVPTDAVEMTPSVSVAIVLAELNQIIAEQQGVAVDELALKDPTSKKEESSSNFVEPKTESQPEKESQPSELEKLTHQVEVLTKIVETLVAAQPALQSIETAEKTLLKAAQEVEQAAEAKPREVGS